MEHRLARALSSTRQMGNFHICPECANALLENDKHRERDPVGQCHMHGVPRVMFPPFPLEILQDGNYVVILS